MLSGHFSKCRSYFQYNFANKTPIKRPRPPFLSRGEFFYSVNLIKDPSRRNVAMTTSVRMSNDKTVQTNVCCVLKVRGIVRLTMDTIATL